MNVSTSDKVNNLLSDIQLLSSDQFDMVVLIRDIFLGAHKELVEGVKYGGIAFSLSEKLIGGIYTYKKHISIEFSNGADFVDSDSLLEGSGNRRRHLKIYKYDDIAQKNIIYFVSQAVSD